MSTAGDGELRVLAIERPRALMGPIIRGLINRGVDVDAVDHTTADAVLDEAYARGADAVLAYFGRGEHLATAISMHIPVVCLVPFDPGLGPSTTTNLHYAGGPDKFNYWRALVGALKRHSRPKDSRTAGRRVVVVAPAGDLLMRDVVHALRAQRLDVVPYRGVACDNIRDEFRRASASLIVARASGVGFSLARAGLPIALVVEGELPLALKGPIARTTTIVRAPTEETDSELAAWAEWAALRRRIADAAGDARVSAGGYANSSFKTETAGPTAIGRGPDVARLQRDLEMQIRSRRMPHARIDATLARPIHVEAVSTTSEALALGALRECTDDEQLQRVVDAILKTTAELSPTLKGHCAKALRRLGDTARAEALVRGITDPDGRVLAADIAEEQGDLQRALGLTDSAAGTRLETLGAVERVARWRQALFAPRPPRRVRSVVPLQLRGEPWTIVFDELPVLGRTDASIVVGAPLVSRRHATFRCAGGVPEVEDARSQHGTYVDGVRLAGALRIDRPRELRLAGSIRCLVRPGTNDEGGASVAVVDVADRRWLLTFGSSATLGGLRFDRADGALVVRAASGEVMDPDVRTPELEVDGDAFE